MNILDKQFAAESNNYISLANIIILISDLTDTPISDTKTYLLNARIGQELDVFKQDDRMSFYRIDLDETTLEDHEDYMVNFRKADLASLAPIAKYNIFNAVDNDYFDNKTWTNDPVEDEFLTIDQTVEYIRSVTGLTYHSELLGNISERGQITPYFYDDSYIAKRIGNFYCEKIKGYFYFKNLGSSLARNGTRAFIGDDPFSDVIYIHSLSSQSANEFKPGDAVNLYSFKPADFKSTEDALITSIHHLNFRFLKSNIDNYLKSIDKLRSYIPESKLNSMLNVNSEEEVFSYKEKIEELNNKILELQLIIKDQKSNVDKLESSMQASDEYNFDWDTMNKNIYPLELHIALKIWEKIYVSNEKTDNHVNAHSKRFKTIAEIIGRLRDGHSAALVVRLRKITTPENSKQKKDIENIENIKL